MPAPPWSPWLKGRKRVAGPCRRVAIITVRLLTAKWTSAPRGKSSSGSANGRPVGLGMRSKRYWSTAAFMSCVKSVLISAVATGMPFKNSTRSMMSSCPVRHCRTTRRRLAA